MNKNLNFFLVLTKTNFLLARRLCVHGLSFTDFMILYFLDQAPEKKLRRIDLADQLGLTASGITRMLIPMEKIGLIKRDTSDLDGRARFALIAPGGKKLLADAAKTLNDKIEDILPAQSTKKIEELTKLLSALKTN